MVNFSTHIKPVWLLVLLQLGFLTSFGCSGPGDKKQPVEQEANTPAAPATTVTPPSPKLDPPVQETSFSVVKGKITNCKSVYKTCNADNYFVVTALNSASIALNGLDYQVTIYRTGAVLPDSTSGNMAKDSLKLFYYIITSQQGGPSPAEQFAKKKQSNGQNYQTKFISEYKAPVTSHYFVEKEKLVLLVYNRMPLQQKAVIEEWIGEVRKTVSPEVRK